MLGLSATDETLIKKALDGSRRSWVKLVQRHEKDVYNYCLRMTRNSSDAMDLLQEVFLTVYRNLPSYRGQGQFKGWLLRITYTRTMDFMRARMRSPQLAGDESIEETCWVIPRRTATTLTKPTSSTTRTSRFSERSPRCRRSSASLCN